MWMNGERRKSRGTCLYAYMLMPSTLWVNEERRKSRGTCWKCSDDKGDDMSTTSQ